MAKRKKNATPAPRSNLKIELGTPTVAEDGKTLVIQASLRDLKAKTKKKEFILQNQVDKSFPHLFKVDAGRLTVKTGEGEEATEAASEFSRGHRIAISRQCKKLVQALVSDETVDEAVRAAAALCVDADGKAL